MLWGNCKMYTFPKLLQWQWTPAKNKRKTKCRTATNEEEWINHLHIVKQLRHSYLGKNTVSTMVKSCKSKSRLGLVDRLVILCPIPSCIAAISSEVGFCWSNTKREKDKYEMTASWLCYVPFGLHTRYLLWEKDSVYNSEILHQQISVRFRSQSSYALSNA